MDHFRIVGSKPAKGSTDSNGGPLSTAEPPSIIAALNNGANSVVDKLTSLDSKKADIIRTMFRRLAEPGAAEDEEVRRPTSRSELIAVTGCPGETLDPLISELIKNGFLTRSSDKDPEIDVTHESLIRRWEVLKAWVKEEADSARIYDRLADTVARHGSPYSGADLKAALEWRAKSQPTPEWAERYAVQGGAFSDAMAFLNRSRRRSLLFRGLGWLVALVVLGMAFTMYEAQRNMLRVADFALESQAAALKAREEALRAQAKTLLALQSQSLANASPNLAQKSLLLGIEAFTIQPTADMERLVRQQFALIPKLQARMQQDGTVSGMQFDSSGKMLVTTSFDKTLRLWDTSSGTELSRKTLPYRVYLGRFDPSNGYIATISIDIGGAAASLKSRISLWRMDGAKLTDPLFEKDYSDLPVFPTISDGKLWLSDRRTLSSLPLGSPDSGLQSETLANSARSFLSDGRLLVIVNDGVIALRDLATGKVTSAQFSAAKSLVRSVLVSADGNYAALIAQNTESNESMSEKLLMWNLESSEAPKTVLDSSKIESVGLSSDGEFAVKINRGTTASADLIETEKGRVLGSMRGGDRDYLGNQAWPFARFSHDNTRVAIASGDGSARVFSLQPWKEVARFGLGERASAFAWGPDDKTVALATDTGLITIWSLGDHEKPDATERGNYTFFSPSGAYYLDVNDVRAALNHVDGGELQESPFHEPGFAFAPDEDRFAWINLQTGEAALSELPAREPHCVTDRLGSVISYAFRAPHTFMTMTSDGTLRSWSDDCKVSNSVSLIKIGTNNDDAPEPQATFSPLGTVVAVASSWDADAMMLFDTATGQQLGTVSLKPNLGSAFSPDDQLLAGRSKDGVTVWETATTRQRWHKSNASVSRFSFDPDSRKLVGTGNHDTYVWDAESGDVLLEDYDETAIAYSGAFDPSTNLLATTWSSGVRVWDLSARVQVADFPFHADWEYGSLLRFSPDSKSVLVGNGGPVTSLQLASSQPTVLKNEVCRHVAFNLAPEDWKRLSGYSPAEPTCPGLPAGKSPEP